MTEREIFIAALEMATPEARAGYLLGACHGDLPLRRKLDELLKEHFSNDSLLAEPSVEGEPPTLKHDRPPEEAPAQMLGRYKLLEKIGEGGFGEVWMAEQREPIKRRVALKIIKLGMDSRQIVNRFAAERQALAMMDHPNIAKIFDADVTETGRPYFVMELVRGIKITEYCDQNQLPTQERLRLFILVCHAIQHAHQKGIIHRDIKPSNILVTLHDGVAVPKVIDFGIAKATQQELTDQTVFTQFQQFIGTPAYISPEQAEMSGLDIDTRADIYSLGVLLYELLVGQTPFDAKEMMQGGLEALRQIIREKEPLRPSTKLNTLVGEARTTAGKRRQTEVGKLVHQLQGDLDWIVMKCLEKDRTRRYDTANGLAADLQRHLANEPVVARPPNLGYLLLKFGRRHRTGVSVATALALTVLLGAGVSVWQAVRASRHADLAETRRREAESSRQVAALAQERAERSVREVSQQLARHYVDNGVQRLDAGDYAGSWVWLAEALRLDQTNPVLESIHRVRLGALSRACPTLLQLFAHTDLVVAAEFSPDGRRLVTASMDKTARVWDVNTGAAITAYLDHTGGIVGASFSPDGQRVVTRGFDKTARIWSAETGAPLTPPLLHGEVVGNAAFSPDGRRLVTVSADQTGRVYTQVWDATTGQPVTTPVPREDGGMWPAVFSPDTRFIVTGLDNTARVWDVDTGQPVTPVLSHTGKVEWAAFTPDGKLVATASADRTARIWDARTGAPVTPPLPHSQGLTYAAFSPDGHRLVTASGESVLKVFPEFPDQKGEARVWDVTSGQPLTPPMSHQQGQVCAAFSPDGRRIVTTSWDKTARIWDAQTGVPLTPPLLHLARVWRASFSPDGLRVATACLDHTARIWDVTDRRILPSELKESRIGGDYLGDYPVSFSPDGQRVVGTDIRGSARVWNTLSGTPLTPSLHANVKKAIFSPDGRLVATVGNRSARLWDAQTGAAMGSPMRHDHRIYHLAFSPDGQRLATASRDQTARLWSVETGALLTPVLQHSSNVLWVAFSPDGLRVVTGSEDKTARVWNATNGAAITPPLPHKDGVLLAAFSPDSRRVVTASGDGNAQVWDANTGVPLAPPMKHSGRFITLGGIESLSFSPDGHRIVIADSTDKTARVWNADTGTPVTPPLRHAHPVPYAAFSHHGRFVVTVSEDKTARVWDAATGQPITPPLQHDGRVDYAMFTADDRALRTISHDPETHIGHTWTWDLSPDARSTKELLLWAELFSGQRFDASGALAPLDAAALVETWRTLRQP